MNYDFHRNKKKNGCVVFFFDKKNGYEVALHASNNSK